MRTRYSFFTYFVSRAFWHLVPTVEVKLRWPVGEITVGPDDPRWDWTLGATYQSGISADPNDHYRPWLEKHVGRQSWHWDWKIVDNDASANCLTLRIRRDLAEYATIAALRWR